MNKIIAITGGIGSGKSTVLKFLEKWGYKSFSADETYKSLILNEDFIKEISSSIGVDPIIIDGRLSLDKTAISNKVFNDKALLERLNSVTHPKIMQQIISDAKKCDGLVFCEVPLLFEGGFENLFDCVLVVMRADKNRFESASKRDNKTVAQIEEIAKNQFDYAKIQENEHTFIIENNGDEVALMENLKFAIEKIKK